MTYTLLCGSKVIEKIITSFLSDYKRVNDDNPDFFIVEDSYLKTKGFSVVDFFKQNLDEENVLFVAASTNQEMLIVFFESRKQSSGKSRYILKPFDKDGLIEKIEQLTS
jgi:DNA-binding response OmpR family regulator